MGCWALCHRRRHGGHVLRGAAADVRPRYFRPAPGTAGGLLTLAPLYAALRARGFVEEDECVNIEGVPVQFLPATTRW